MTLEQIATKAPKSAWRRIVWRKGTKGDLQAVGWKLFDFLTSDATYLHRYHCARVLLERLGDKRYEAADLTVAHRNPARALADVERELTEAIGPR